MDPDLIELHPPAAPTVPDNFRSSCAFFEILERTETAQQRAANRKLAAEYALLRGPRAALPPPLPPPSKEWSDYRAFMARYFPELFRSPEIEILRSAGASRDVLYCPRTEKTVLGWIARMNGRPRWRGRRDAVSLEQVLETRTHDELAELAGLIEQGRVTVRPGDFKAPVIRLLKGEPVSEHADSWPIVKGFAEKSDAPSTPAPRKRSTAFVKGDHIPDCPRNSTCRERRGWGQVQDGLRAADLQVKDSTTLRRKQGCGPHPFGKSGQNVTVWDCALKAWYRLRFGNPTSNTPKSR